MELMEGVAYNRCQYGSFSLNDQWVVAGPWLEVCELTAQLSCVRLERVLELPSA